MSLDTYNPNQKEILTGSFSAEDDLRGAPLSEFHISHEEESGNATGKIGAALAIALVIGGVGAYSFFNSGTQPAPKNVVAVAPKPAPMPAPVAAPATDTAMDQTVVPAVAPEAVKSAPVKTAANPAPVRNRVAASASVQPETQVAAAPAPVEAAPVMPSAPQSSLAINGLNAAPEVNAAAQSAEPQAAPAPVEAQPQAAAPAPAVEAAPAQ